jgi:hypothetical protein
MKTIFENILSRYQIAIKNDLSNALSRRDNTLLTVGFILRLAQNHTIKSRRGRHKNIQL